jgi:hypothetical protein
MTLKETREELMRALGACLDVVPEKEKTELSNAIEAFFALRRRRDLDANRILSDIYGVMAEAVGARPSSREEIDIDA